MGIFKAYDIRGIYGQDLTDDMFRKIARAYAKFTGVRKVVVARDCRTHSEPLFAAFAKGLNDVGVDVIDIGRASTPMSYFANASLKADGSVMITASHNTKEWNGCKLCRANAVPISGATGIKDIERMVETGDLGDDAAVKGTVTQVDVSAQYAAHVREFAHLARPVHVAMDFANGMGIAESAAFAGSDLTYDSLYGEYDGDFPNHDANPLHRETLRDLQALMKANPGKYAFGVAYDGDADRCVFVSDTGEYLPGDVGLALLSILEMRKSSGRKQLVSTVALSKMVEDAVAAEGGETIRTAVGSPIVARKMMETGAPIGGEDNGGIIFADHQFCRDGAMAAARMMEFIAKNGSIQAQVDKLPKYHTIKEAASCPDNMKQNVIEVIAKNHSDDRLDTTDGLKISYDDGWVLLRPSGTEPKFRIYSESKDPQVALYRAKSFYKEVTDILSPL